MMPQVLMSSVALAALVQLLPLKGLLAWVLLLPLLAGFLILLLPAHSVGAHRVLALTATVATLLLSLRLWAGFEAWAVEPFQQIVGFTAEWSGLVWIRLEFGLDGLNLWMVLLTAVLMPLAVLCSWMTQQAHSQAFMALLLVLETALLAAFTCLDILGFYVLYESALLPMFLLIGLGGSRPRKVRAAYLLVLYTLVGSLAMLPCILLMMSQAGTTSLELLLHEEWQPARQLVLWWGLFLAFAVKVPMMPVHLWLPEAHVEASTAGSVLLAGVLLKLGTYGFLRFQLPLFPDACVYYGPFVITLSLLGIVYASLTTLRQVDLKKIVAYSSVAHMNVVVLAVFALSDLGAQAAAFLMLAHGVASPAMFLGVGTLYDRTHTKALKYLGGAATAMPLWSMMFFIFSLANMALPMTPNFIAEFLCLCSIFAHNGWALFGACLGVILSAVYTLWAYARVVHGMPKPQFFKALTDLNRRETWTFIPLLLILIWWGIKPGLVLDQLSAGLWYWNQVNFGSLGVDSWVLEVNQAIAQSLLISYFSFLLLLRSVVFCIRYRIKYRLSYMVIYVLVQVLATAVPLLLAVAFLTLVERKVMGAMQRRVGPNVWGFGGLLQPFFDALKLIVKEPILPSSADQPLFIWAPVLAFLTSQAAWAALPTCGAGAVSELHLGTMYVLAIGSLGVYGVLLAGWASNSKYAFLGCCRSVAQMISYELPMGLIVLTACIIAGSLNWSQLVACQEYGWFFWPLWPMALIWGICCLAETNRAPFDLPEAEAELVAGYNVEYASMGFALFFMAEYANMLLMGTVTSLLFFGGTAAPLALLNWIPGTVWLALKTTFVVFTFVWVRATLPRYRYDQLMRLGWKVFLPLTLAGFVATASLVLTFQLM